MTCLTNSLFHARANASFNIRSKCSAITMNKARVVFARNRFRVVTLSVIISAVSSPHGPDLVMLP